MIHVVHIMANNSSVPYFNWFAESVHSHPGFKFSFIALYREEPEMMKDMASRKCDCYWIKFDDKQRKRDMIYAFVKLYRLFKKIKPGIVHTHLFDDSLPGLLAARIAGVPVRVVTKQDTGFHYLYHPGYVWMDRFNNFNATHIHTVAAENTRFVIENEKAPEKKVHLIRNGFPFDSMTAWHHSRVEELKNRYYLENRLVIGTVARLIPWKGHKKIIEAARILIPEFPSLKFIWTGTGDPVYVRELKDKINTYGLQDNFCMTGWLERSYMPSFYKTLDLYLHPAHPEPFGFAISEALMNQIPIIATRTGSTDLITHLREGFILDLNTPEQIAAAIKYFIHHSEIRKKIAFKGMEHAKKHLVFEQMMEGHLNLYQKALQKKR